MAVRILPVLVALFFAMAMTVKGAANALVFLMALLSLPQIRQSSDEPMRRYLFWALSLLALMTMLQILAGFGEVNIKALDAPMRFVFAAIGLWGLSRVPTTQLRLAMWGIPIGALGLGVWGWLSTHVQAYVWIEIGTGRAWNGFSNPIAFGVYSALFALWVWVLPTRQMVGQRFPVAGLQGLQVIAALAALVGVYYSGTRAAQIICLPALVLVLRYRYRLPVKWMALLVAAVSVLAILAVSFSPDRFSTRFREGITEIQHYDAHRDSSMGLRLSMWQYAGKLFVEHPLAGVGRQGYYREVSKFSHDASPIQLISSAPHPHNEILNLAVEFGITGIVIGLALFAVPGMLFRRYLGHPDPVLAFAALAGMLVVVCQFVAGWFDAYFWIVSQTSFYGMSVVIFASMIFSRKRELGLT